MIVTIHQPEHMPWLGFFHKMASSDVMVILDNVQYRKGYFQNRNRILTRYGVTYLTVPVSPSQSESRNILDIQISPEFKTNKYLNKLHSAYMHHPYFNLYFDKIVKIFEKRHAKLADLNLDIILYLMGELNIHTPVYKASELNVTGYKTEINLNICKALGADVYLSGPSGRDYLDTNLFAQNDIKVVFHEFSHPSYPQMNSEAFVPQMSVIDLLFNCGQSSQHYLRT